MLFALAMLGVFAGALTTVAGQGGGLFLLLVCSQLLGPHVALAVTAPALLLGNVHRAAVFRAHIDRGVALRMVAGALPGAFAGGLVAGVAPTWLLHAMLVALSGLAIARALGWMRFGVPRAALVPAGLVVGGMTGTAGGAGVLLAPVLLSAGLSGRAFVGTIAVVAVAMHVGRVTAYASAGLFTWGLAVSTAALTLAIFVGNALGERLRARTSERTTSRLEYGVLVVCVVLALAGIA